VTVRVQGKDPQPVSNPQRDAAVHRTFGGHGSDVDIIVASAKAYLSALNKLHVARAARAESATAQGA